MHQHNAKNIILFRIQNCRHFITVGPIWLKFEGRVYLTSRWANNKLKDIFVKYTPLRQMHPWAYACHLIWGIIAGIPESNRKSLWCYMSLVNLNCLEHDDVIKWKHFPRNWPFVRKIHRSPVNFPHKGQWRGALMFSLIYVWINDWANNREAGDLRRQHGHYDVIVMKICFSLVQQKHCWQWRNWVLLNHISDNYIKYQWCFQLFLGRNVESKLTETYDSIQITHVCKIHTTIVMCSSIPENNGKLTCMTFHTLIAHQTSATFSCTLVGSNAMNLTWSHRSLSGKLWYLQHNDVWDAIVYQKAIDTFYPCVAIGQWFSHVTSHVKTIQWPNMHAKPYLILYFSGLS